MKKLILVFGLLCPALLVHAGGFESMQQSFEKSIRTNIDSALELATLMIDKAQVENNTEWEARGYISKGTALSYMGNIFGAIRETEKALAIAKKANLKPLIVSACYELGMYNMQTSNNEASLRYYMQALKLTEETGDVQKTMHVLFNIGTVYRLDVQYEKSLAYYQKAYLLAQKQGDKALQALLCSVMAYNYLQKKEFQQAGNYVSQSTKLYTETGNEQGLVQVNILSGKLWAAQGRVADAERSYKEALKKAVNINDTKYVYEINLELGRLMLESKKYQQAIIYAKAATEKARDMADLYAMRDACELSQNIYTAMGKKTEAQQYEKMFAAINDSLHQQEMRMAQAMQEMHESRQKMELEEKKLELEKMKRQQEKLVAAKNKRDTQPLFIVLGISIAVALVVLFLVMRSRKRRTE